MKHANPILATLAALTVLLAMDGADNRAVAQRLGLEVGAAGVENQETSPAIGASIALPLTSRLRALASYTRWAACDEVDCDPRGFGNEGANLLALYRVAGSANTGLHFGAGVGWYEKVFDDFGERDAFWEEALTGAVELRRATSYNSSMYLRGEVSFPADDNNPDWGFLRLGVDVGVF